MRSFKKTNTIFLCQTILVLQKKKIEWFNPTIKQITPSCLMSNPNLKYGLDIVWFWLDCHPINFEIGNTQKDIDNKTSSHLDIHISHFSKTWLLHFLNTSNKLSSRNQNYLGFLHLPHHPPFTHLSHVSNDSCMVKI